MNNEELRSGNWINTKEFHVEKLRGLYQYNPSWYKYVSMFEPIPLTEEWLIKFGGEKDENGDAFLCIDEENDLRIYLKNGHALLCKGDCCPMFEYEHVDKVHLFQNLVHALTGEEITLNK